MKIEMLNMREGCKVAVCIGEMNLSLLKEQLPSCGFVQVSEFDWNRDLTPWFALKIFRQGEDFGGKADEFLIELETQILPVLELYKPENVWVVGYSLAGLFALYAASKCPWITGCASVSGSLWYPQWCSYLEVHPLYSKRIYLSVGEREKMSRNALMKTVEQCTEQTCTTVSSYAEAVFELNEGGHFDNRDERLLRALCWLNRE